ncbi:MAG: DUF3473 domain-containing protein [Planctomycetota bacterium]|nr:MAG: DUF3473 domain-containing protein [Planctomycetota bacterium]
MINALTIDVEDYYNLLHRHQLKRSFPPTEAVVKNTYRLMEHFTAYNVHGTFFVLGEVAEAFPQLIRDIAAAGHELGVHGYSHRQVFNLTPESFRQEIGKAKTLIEDITGTKVQGHRAPIFSITPQTDWALEVLAEAGFRYDSSIFPIKRRGYGWPGFPLNIHKIKLDNRFTIIEAPLSTITVLGKKIPVCGGGYLRHLPLAFTRWAMRRIQQERPVILYMHPYEIEITSKSLDTSGVNRAAALRTLLFHTLQKKNRHTVEGKLIRLLNEFSFAPLNQVIDSVINKQI